MSCFATINKHLGIMIEKLQSRNFTEKHNKNNNPKKNVKFKLYQVFVI